MSAKEKLRQTVERLSESEAAETLNYLAQNHRPSDTLDELLDRAQLDDEPGTPEEEEGVREAKAEIARGELSPRMRSSARSLERREPLGLHGAHQA